MGPTPIAIRRGLLEEGLTPDVAARGEDAIWMAGSTDYDAVAHETNHHFVYQRLKSLSYEPSRIRRKFAELAFVFGD